jgi:hypothetical protein
MTEATHLHPQASHQLSTSTLPRSDSDRNSPQAARHTPRSFCIVSTPSLPLDRSTASPLLSSRSLPFQTQRLHLSGLFRGFNPAFHAVQTSSQLTRNHTSLGFVAPSMPSVICSDLHRDYLPRLCCAFRFSQPLDALIPRFTFQPYFMPKASLGFIPSEVSPQL